MRDKITEISTEKAVSGAGFLWDETYVYPFSKSRTDAMTQRTGQRGAA